MEYKEKIFNFLVIEDNPGDLFIVEELLKDKFPNCLISSRTEFKQIAETLRGGPQFDIILLDLSLPDKSGQELITEMLKLVGSCPIIILSGYSNVEFSIQSISQGIYDYLLKEELNATALAKRIIYAIEWQKNIFAIRESEKRYGDLFYRSPQPMWVFNPATLKFVQVNKATITLYGYSEEEFLRMTMLDIKMPETEHESEKPLSPKTPVDKAVQGPFRHRKKSGEMIEVEIYSGPIVIRNAEFGLVIAHDITMKTRFELELTKAIIKAQEDERFEIGGELHDNVCPMLAASQADLRMLKPLLGASAERWFNQCFETIRSAMDEIRNISHRLTPIYFAKTTLKESFDKLLESVNVGHKYKISLNLNTAITRHPLSDEIRLNLYRIMQEQLRNIFKYAKARTIDIDLSICQNTLEMIISDDGVGFDVVAKKNGIGLANMKRRTELFDGNFKILSVPGKGCSIVVKIPMISNKYVEAICV